MSVIDPYDELQQHIAETEARFASESQGGAMTVLRDDGAYRHLRFDLPKATWKWFELVTWPGMLVVHGGLGCWTFHRDGVDMMATARPAHDTVRVNPYFWEQRFTPGSQQTAKTYSPGRALALLREAVAENEEIFPGLAPAAAEWIFSVASGELQSESGLRDLLHRFHTRYEETTYVQELVDNLTDGKRLTSPFRFPIEEWDLHVYDPWFLLTCAALPWAAEQYDAMLTPAG